MRVIARRCRIPVAGAVLLLSCLTHDLSAQNLRGAHLWMANGRIRAVERGGRSLYIGGDFNYVGPLTGAAVTLKLEEGGLAGRPARVAGTVFQAVSDGAGGWFVGGQGLGHSESSGPQYLIHLLADGSLDPVDLPQPDGPIYALARSGNTLYVGGDFTRLAAHPRMGGGVIEIASRAVLGWNPDIRGVTSGGRRGPLGFLLTKDSLIAAGNFTTVGGEGRPNIAAVDLEQGKPLPWNPGTDYSVNQIVRAGDTLYLGGIFATVAGAPRASLAAVDLVTGAVLPWNPGSNGQLYALALDGTTLYAGGTFTSLGGQERFGAGGVDILSGNVESWDPKPDVNLVSAIAVSHARVYLSGAFMNLAGQQRLHLGAVNSSTGNPTPWMVHAAEAANTMAIDDESLLVGGSFKSVGGVPRAFGAALDLETGEATRWNPDANGSITSIAVGEASVFVAGGFDNIGGAARRYAAELDRDRGMATAWNPPGSDRPLYTAIALTPQYVYVGGKFAHIGGRAQGGLAELERATGALTPRNIGTEAVLGVSVDALWIDRTTRVLYAGGLFTKLAGARRSSLGAVNLNTGLATPWDPDVTGQVWAVDGAANTLYVGGDFDSIGGIERENAGAVLLSTGEVTDWNPMLTKGDEVFGTTLTVRAGPSVVYLGGSFTLVNDAVHRYVAAVDPVLGAMRAWDPMAGDSLEQGFSGYVYDIELYGRSALLAGDFSALAGTPRSALGAVSNSASLSAR